MNGLTASQILAQSRRRREAEMDRNAESHDFVDGVCCRCEAVAGTIDSRLNDCRSRFGLVHFNELLNSQFRHGMRATVRKLIMEAAFK